MASASTPSANEPAKDLVLVHAVQLNPMIKAHFSGRMVSSGIRDIAFDSVYPEKTRLKKLMIMIVIMKIDFRYETKARKVMVDFKFESLYR